MLKSEWLNLVLDVNFVTFNYFELELFSYSLNSSYSWGHHHFFKKEILVENHQFNVILSYFKQKFHNYLFNITTCSVLLNV